MAEAETKLIVKINPIPDLDLEELEQLTRNLQQELLELDIESAEFATIGKELTGAKAGEPVNWGTIIVTLLAAGGVATKLVDDDIHSIFTRAIVNGIETGAADLDKDEHISLDELYDYVYYL